MGLSDKLWAGIGIHQVLAHHRKTVVHYPGGKLPNTNLPAGVTITNALVAFDTMMGTNEMSGDGAITRDDSGDRERRTGHLEVPMSVEVTEKDLWLIDGDIWTTQRMDAKDSGTDAQMQGWRITSKLGRRTQHALPKTDRPLRRG